MTYPAIWYKSVIICGPELTRHHVSQHCVRNSVADNKISKCEVNGTYFHYH